MNELIQIIKILDKSDVDELNEFIDNLDFSRTQFLEKVI